MALTMPLTAGIFDVCWFSAARMPRQTPAEGRASKQKGRDPETKKPEKTKG